MKAKYKIKLIDILDKTLLAGFVFMAFSSVIYSLQTSSDDKWFSRYALALIILGLWLIQHRLKAKAE